MNGGYLRPFQLKIFFCRVQRNNLLAALTVDKPSSQLQHDLSRLRESLKQHEVFLQRYESVITEPKEEQVTLAHAGWAKKTQNPKLTKIRKRQPIS
ncbi:MAG: hypothetical protein IPG70_07255 [Moraxellaceae bacterium]|nr:hypothetical protein [Moraxellaceae bacterium]